MTRLIGAAIVVLGLLQEHQGAKPTPKEGGWLKRHEAFVAEAKKGDVELLLLGDSITDAWRQPKNKAVWDKHLPSVKMANFGLSGDRTQHLLWRLQNGELDGIQPSAAMILIGTNNIGQQNGEAAASAVEGIEAVVKEVRARCPKTRMLLLGVFPRSEKPDHPHRAQIKEINEAIAKLDDGGKSVQFLDIGAKFLAADGSLTKEIMPDFLHLSEKGYEVWAEAVKAPLGKLLAK
jgi:lysophospholipase L1-like esterase